MTGKIKIKYGHIEIECEGSEEFLKNELLEIIKAISELPQKAAPQPSPLTSTNEQYKQRITTNLSVNTIAQKSTASTGPKLALAACAKLQLTDAKDTFSQKEIVSAMREAKSFFKKSYASNIGIALKTLTKQGKLNQINADNYSLSEQCLAEFKQSLEIS